MKLTPATKNFFLSLINCATSSRALNVDVKATQCFGIVRKFKSQLHNARVINSCAVHNLLFTIFDKGKNVKILALSPQSIFGNKEKHYGQ